LSTDLTLDLERVGDDLEAAVRRDLRRGRRPAALAVAVALAVLIAGGTAIGASLLGGRGHFEHGKFQFPTALADRMAQLNAALEACYLNHGATMSSLGDGAYGFNDPAGRAKRACVVEQRAVNAFADGPEMAAAGKAAGPVLQAFWNCIEQSGVIPDGAKPLDTTGSAYRSAADNCSAKANAAGR
jgi:hypothetical protein